ncbi:MAG TPA: phospholipase D-like domain-containing protein [Candidatus Brocadiia bacterium]|nr:phospholipase D-like domain-containing protein [Candidatus Brocadiales bacterium]
MSPATVKAGGTDPNEIERLIKRGVLVFTRRNLHAKIVITDKRVLVGSANISRNSRDNLEEAALLTKDPLAVRRARDFFSRICTEPVRDEYLRECKRIYMPPKRPGQRKSNKKHIPPTTPAKLWLENLYEGCIPQKEVELFKQSENRAQKLIKDTSRSKLSNFWYSYKPKMADELQMGDWIIQCIRHEDKSISVLPPGRLRWIDKYIRNTRTRKERYVFHLELPKRGQEMDWKDFRAKTKVILGQETRLPRTKPVRDIKKADDLLRLWTPGGRIAGRR